MSEETTAEFDKAKESVEAVEFAKAVENLGESSAKPNPLLLPDGFGSTLLPDKPPPVNLVHRAEQHIEVACQTWANTRGEDVDFAVGLNLMSDPQGQLAPVLGVFLSIPAVVLGHRMHAAVIVEAMWGDQDYFDGMVRSTIQQLIAARTAQAQAVPAGPPTT